MSCCLINAAVKAVKFHNINDEDNPVLHLTSLMDVVFILLIFFMCVTTFKKHENHLKLELPKTESSTIENLPDDNAYISVSKKGVLEYQGKITTLSQLGVALTNDKNNIKQITIRGDKETNYGKIIDVLYLCSKAGITSISIETLQMDKKGEM